MTDQLNQAFKPHEDVVQVRQTRLQGDADTLRTLWNRNQFLTKTLKALDGLSGEGYSFKTSELMRSTPDQTGSAYVAPTIWQDITCMPAKGSPEESTARIELNLDGEYTILNAMTPPSVTTNVANDVVNIIQGWLVVLQGKHGFQCMQDLTRAMDRAETAQARQSQKQRNPKPV